MWHTPEHLLSTSLDQFGKFQTGLLKVHLQRGLGMWLLSLLGVAFLCWRGRHDLSAYQGAVFLALSALTVPHMALAEICRRPESAVRDRAALRLPSRQQVQP